jgi:choice-of-anchor C domain-containing protein
MFACLRPAPIRALAALLLAATGASAAQAVSIVSNGSFESGPAAIGTFKTYSAGSTAITGWKVTSGSIDYIGTYWAASDGKRSLDMSGKAPGTIVQTLATAAGQRYRLTFDLSSNPDQPSLKTMLVHFGDSTPVSVVSPPVSKPMTWVPHSLIFTASSAATDLKFQSTFGGPWGVALDNVAVSAVVPEPATWAMLIAGFGLVGAALRRRPTMARVSA